MGMYQTELSAGANKALDGHGCHLHQVWPALWSRSVWATGMHVSQGSSYMQAAKLTNTKTCMCLHVIEAYMQALQLHGHQARYVEPGNYAYDVVAQCIFCS